MAKLLETDFETIADPARGLPASSFTVLTGINGSGKSRFLRLVLDRRSGQGRRCLAISGSNYDKFKGAARRTAKVLSPRKGDSSPDSILKAAITNAFRGDEILLRSVSRILRYCGYSPEVGVKVVGGKSRRYLRAEEELPAIVSDNLRLDAIFSAKMLVERFNERTVWLAFDDISFHQSSESNLSLVLAEEDVLKGIGLLRRVDLYLRRKDSQIALKDASSGELVLITQLAFISTYLREGDMLLVDEPENSLHPHWQREYIDLLREAVSYRRCDVMLATHSPLIVLGAHGVDGALIANLNTRSPGIVSASTKELVEPGLEEVMAEVFETITPRNHYLSRKLIGLLDELDSKKISLDEFNRVLVSIEESGVDSSQTRAIQLTKEMSKKRVQ